VIKLGEQKIEKFFSLAAIYMKLNAVPGTITTMEVVRNFPPPYEISL
jgi:hypothetical protein